MVDLKLSAMGLVARIAAATTLMFAALYVLQVDDSIRPTETPVAAIMPSAILVSQADTSGREYFIKHHTEEYVPIGHGTISLPILMYHYIRPLPSMRTDLLGYRLSVSPETFQQQMDWLAANGYHAVNFNDVRAYFAGRHSLPPKPVVITLDDGYRDLYTTAFPILAAHRFTAVAYIVTGFVNQPRYVTADQIVEMDRAGIEIASHTVNHADLARMSFAACMAELVGSKFWLEHLLGHPVVDFAYPSGRISPTAIAAVHEAGYDTAVTEMVSIVHSQADRYTWTRIRVGGGESLSDFVAGLGSSMSTSQTQFTNVDIEEVIVNRKQSVTRSF